MWLGQCQGILTIDITDLLDSTDIHKSVYLFNIYNKSIYNKKQEMNIE